MIAILGGWLVSGNSEQLCGNGGAAVGIEKLTKTPFLGKQYSSVLAALSLDSVNFITMLISTARFVAHRGVQRSSPSSLLRAASAANVSNLTGLSHRSEPSTPFAFRQFSSSNDLSKFTSDFLAEVTNVPHATDPASSSQALRSLVR